jgi:hypothetical protein
VGIRIELLVIIAIALLFAAPSQLFSQQELVDRKTGISVSYLGETGSHPGLVVGIVHPLIQNNWYQLGVSLDIGGYVHPRNHYAAFLRSTLSNRITAGFGLYAELGIGAGYFHTWAAGEVYTRQSDGSIAKIANFGYPHAMISADLNIGFDFVKLDILPIGVFLGLSVFGEYPFNGFLLPHVAAQVGMSWKL